MLNRIARSHLVRMVFRGGFCDLKWGVLAVRKKWIFDVSTD
jgi:hypothetical protein